MNPLKLLRFRVFNSLKTVFLILSMAFITSFLAYIIAGELLALLSLIFILSAYIFTPSIAPGMVLKYFRARKIGYTGSSELFRVVRYLSSRAGLGTLPDLYYIPSEKIAAFATGDKNTSGIALTKGLLSSLSLSEVAGVIGHEISHIKNNDLRVMWFALTMNRVTGFLSLVGQVLLILNLPLIVFSDFRVGWFTIAVLVFAPTVSYLIQLTLSRVREFNADMGSAELTGSPEPLISALKKIEYGPMTIFGNLFFRKRKTSESSLFTTHPPTEERIERLNKLRLRQPVPSGAELNIPANGSYVPLRPSVVKVRRIPDMYIRNNRSIYYGLY